MKYMGTLYEVLDGISKLSGPMTLDRPHVCLDMRNTIEIDLLLPPPLNCTLRAGAIDCKFVDLYQMITSTRKWKVLSHYIYITVSGDTPFNYGHLPSSNIDRSCSEKVHAIWKELDIIRDASRLVGPRPKDVFLAKFRINRAKFRMAPTPIKTMLEQQEQRFFEISETSRVKEYLEAEFIYGSRWTVSMPPAILDKKTYDVALSEMRRLGAECVEWYDAQQLKEAISLDRYLQELWDGQ